MAENSRKMDENSRKTVGTQSTREGRKRSLKFGPDVPLPDPGAQYTGGLQGGKPHGKGTMIWTDGKKYVGEWKDGLANGQGTMTLPGGRKYIGKWKDGHETGQGTFTGPDKNN